MSLAKKCNRCGKYYDPYPKGATRRHNGVRRLCLSDTGSLLDHGDMLDLCPECMDAFDKFMTSGGRFDDKT